MGRKGFVAGEFWVAGQQFIGHPVYPPGGGFLVVELQPFSLRMDTKIEIFGGKLTHVPPQTTSFFGIFSSFLRVFSPVGTPRICKKVPFSGRNHTRRKHVNLKKTTIILPFFVPPDDESALRESPGSGPCPQSRICCSGTENVAKNPAIFPISGHSARNLRSPP